MKNIKVSVLIGLAILLSPVMITAQQPALSPHEIKAAGHREVLQDSPKPNQWNGQRVTPGLRAAGEGFFTNQVNVDANGNNIVGDAANEPSITVNPKNPQEIVIGWRQFGSVTSNFRQAGMGYSHDGGETWTNPGPLEPTIFRSDPVLDSDSSGTVFYNSLTNNNGNYTCKVFRSSDAGVTWDAGVEAFGGDKQWMYIDRSLSEGNGNIYSNWTSYYSTCMPGNFTRSTNHGNSYENCIAVDGDTYWGTLSTGNNGELYIAGNGASYGITFVRSSNAKIPGASVYWDLVSVADMDGNISSGPVLNPVGLLGQAYIDVDRSTGPGRGNIYVLASMVRVSNGDPGDVMFAKSTDGGLTWSLPVRINDDPTEFHHQWFGTMSVAPNGRIDVIWLDTRHDLASNILSELYYCYSADQGETWSINKKISNIFNPMVGYPQQNKMGDYFDMESDNTGAHLAWANTLNDEQDVYYTHIVPSIVGVPDGGTLTAPALHVMPNPIGDKARFSFTVPVTSRVTLKIFNLHGQLVSTLLDETRQTGIHTYETDLSFLSAGCYTGHLSTGNQKEVVCKIIKR
jgi:hypothetical protein